MRKFVASFMMAVLFLAFSACSASHGGSSFSIPNGSSSHMPASSSPVASSGTVISVDPNYFRHETKEGYVLEVTIKNYHKAIISLTDPFLEPSYTVMSPPLGSDPLGFRWGIYFYRERTYSVETYRFISPSNISDSFTITLEDMYTDFFKIDNFTSPIHQFPVPMEIVDKTITWTLDIPDDDYEDFNFYEITQYRAEIQAPSRKPWWFPFPHIVTST